MFKIKKTLFLLVIILTLSLGVNFSFQTTEKAHAQLSSENGITISTTPGNPKPLENVTISLGSYNFDLDSAKISWYLNTKLQISGTGNKSFSFTSPKAGERSEIEALIEKDGEKISKKTTIIPTEIDLLWEADSYTPPFYRGRALPTRESQIKIVAIPSVKTGGRQLGSRDFSYQWKYRGAISSSYSGFAKNTYYLKNSFLDTSERAEVEARSLDGNLILKNSVSLNMGNPEIIFYPRDDIYGVDYTKGFIGKIPWAGLYSAIVAYPYFMATKDLNSDDLKYTVKINEQNIDIEEPKNVIDFAKYILNDKDRVDVQIESNSKIFQTAKNSFRI